MLLGLGEEIDRRNLVLRPGHQECRIYKPQRHVTESRAEEETNRQLIRLSLSGKKIIKKAEKIG